MKPILTPDIGHEELSRRNLIRKAAYTTPAIFAIAVAPRTALGASGPPRDPEKPKPHKPNKPHHPHKPDKPGNSGGKVIKVVNHNTTTVQNVTVEQAVNVAPAGGEVVVRYLPNTGAGDDQTNADASKSLITAASLSLMSAAGAMALRKRDQEVG